MKRKVIIAVIIFVIISIIVPICINEAYKSGKGYVTVWDGSDALSYFGSFIGAIGAIVLGVIAWKQNERLLALEERSFLAGNAGSALITEMTVTGVKTIACNFENHVEQIVATQNVQGDLHPLEYGSVSLLCKMVPMDPSQHIAMVRVKSALLMASKNRETIDFHTSLDEIDEQYSAVAISQNYDSFQFTIIMTSDEKRMFINSINDLNSMLSIDLELLLLTDKYVETSIKCRTRLYNPDYDEKEEIYSHFKTIDAEPPMCFWHGASVKRKEDITVKTLMEDKNNG